MMVIWIIPATLLALVAYAAISAWRLQREMNKIPPPDPPLCPKCGHGKHAVVNSGFWDGVGNNGEWIGGGYIYATCDRCSSRWAKWGDKPTYAPSDEEWDRHVDAPKCPKCGHYRHTVLSSGLWDGVGNDGEWIGGGYWYGKCDRCSARWAKWNNEPTYVPSDEEWKQYVRQPNRTPEQ